MMSVECLNTKELITVNSQTVINLRGTDFTTELICSLILRIPRNRVKWDNWGIYVSDLTYLWKSSLLVRENIYIFDWPRC